MHYLITGARGFVMSVLVKKILAATDATITAVDLYPPDGPLTEYLGDTQGRLRFTTADVRDSGAMTDLMATHAPDVVVHGATVTHDDRTERRDPALFISVNLTGTTNVLDAARQADTCPRVLLVSSGAVYGRSSVRWLTEDTPCDPDEMYGVSKYSSELVAGRFAELYSMDVPVARLTKMFGPMERPSSGRAVMSLPFHLARAAAWKRPVALTSRTLTAAGDWLSATQAAEALLTLTMRAGLDSRIYNISSGVRTPVSTLVELFGADIVEAADGSAADFDMDPAADFGKNGIYANDRARDELSWDPASLADQVDEYKSWACSHRNLLPGL